MSLKMQIKRDTIKGKLLEMKSELDDVATKEDFKRLKKKINNLQARLLRLDEIKKEQQIDSNEINALKNLIDNTLKDNEKIGYNIIDQKKFDAVPKDRKELLRFIEKRKLDIYNKDKAPTGVLYFRVLRNIGAIARINPDNHKKAMEKRKLNGK